MKNVAVILSGSGVFDGTEIHEAVLTLLAIEQQGASYTCFAPDVEQMHVVNHLTGEVDGASSRNVLVESARIARGNVKPLTECDPEQFDALVLPGGFGAAKNLCNFATNGTHSTVNDELFTLCRQFAALRKPAAYACIAPVIAAHVYGDGVHLTIGNDKETASSINEIGANHVDCAVDDIVIDNEHKVVTTPAYMLAESIVDAQKGLSKMVQVVLSMK
jgi:enhancing lycopene biosynthesis protein 2